MTRLVNFFTISLIAFFILIPFGYTQENLQQLPSIELKNQFDEKVLVNSESRFIIFSADKNVSDTINKVLEENKISSLETFKGIYVADISAMPTMITEMFAIPKMKKYSFKLALDREGDISKKIPQEKGKATLLEIKNLQIIRKSFTDNASEIKKFIDAFKN